MVIQGKGFKGKQASNTMCKLIILASSLGMGGADIAPFQPETGLPDCERM